MAKEVAAAAARTCFFPLFCLLFISFENTCLFFANYLIQYYVIIYHQKILEDIASVVCHLSKGAEKGFYGDNSQDKPRDKQKDSGVYDKFKGLKFNLFRPLGRDLLSKPVNCCHGKQQFLFFSYIYFI